MEQSKLENIPDKILYLIIKKINDSINIDLEDSDFIEESDSIAKIMGIGNLDYIDYNYIASTFELNTPSFWEKDKLEGEINRPKPKLYLYDWYERKIETVETTYRLQQTSYSSKLVEDTIRMIDNDGNLEWYDGKEIDREYIDGETTDSGFIRGSIRERK